ncbi:hypothetical protein GQ54DRAFT_75649 [Martensiomyces pterosporus]|nr:hypothetical protein GQ54DRAFT_75649 [Martensiomyces pterosporus]
MQGSRGIAGKRGGGNWSERAGRRQLLKEGEAWKQGMRQVKSSKQQNTINRNLECQSIENKGRSEGGFRCQADCYVWDSPTAPHTRAGARANSARAAMKITPNSKQDGLFFLQAPTQQPGFLSTAVPR